MNIQTRSMHRDEIMAAINDVYRIMWCGEVASESCLEDRIDSNDDLGDALWMLDYDDPKPKQVTEYFSDWFGVVLDVDQIRELLKRKKAKFGDLVDNITAQEPQVAVIEPATVLGRESWEATVFSAIREGLARRGIDVGALRPSTRVEVYFRDHARELVEEISKIAPGRLPSDWKYKYRLPTQVIDAIGLVGAAIGVLLILFGGVALFVSRGRVWIILPIGGGLLAAGYLSAFATSKAKPVTIDVGGIKTFRDLCFALSVEFR